MVDSISSGSISESIDFISNKGTTFLRNDNGIVTQLHQNYLFENENSSYNDEQQYLNALKSIEYDILSGNLYLYNYIYKQIAMNLKFA